MKSLILTTLFFYLFLLSGYTQSLRIINKEIRDKYTLREEVPEKIIESITDHKKNGSTTKSKETIRFSESGDTITRTRYKGSRLDLLATDIYNSDNQKVFKEIYRHTGEREMVITIQYTYHNNRLIKIHRTQALKTSGITDESYGIITTDTLGNPIRSELFDGSDNLYLYQTVDWDYEANRLLFQIYDSLDNRVRKETHFIHPPIEYNEQGDEIYYPEGPTVGNRRFFKAAYTYDAKENWILKKEWLIRMKDGEVVEERLFKTTKRKIDYR